jgi:predicted Rossmann fold nucleotide-binding protein DprA/Smf involved in DNA uptake
MMENNSKKKSGANKEPIKIHKEIRSVFEGQESAKKMSYDDIEKDLNSKIMEITMIIKDKFPELLKYLDEMPMTLPTEKNPEITIKNLNAYYDSLNALLTKYKLEHS